MWEGSKLHEKIVVLGTDSIMPETGRRDVIEKSLVTALNSNKSIKDRLNKTICCV